MAKPDSDRNLMVGILALQLSLVTEPQLLTAFKAWSFDKSKLIEDLFLEQGAIGKDTRDLLRGLVERGAKTQGIDPKTKLASDEQSRRESLPTIQAAVRKLSAIGDEEVRDSAADFLNESGASAELNRPTQPFDKSARGERFRIVTPVAEGGLGRVSLAQDLELHREVALKEILPKYLSSQETRARFLIEAEVTGRLEHPGIVPVYSLGDSHEGGPFYAMQFIRGISLAEAIRKVHSRKPKLSAHLKRLEIRKLIVRLVMACQAIHYAHTKGVLHRDIKPQNIMLGKFGETFVVDWGLARVNKTDSGPVAAQHDESMLIPSGSGSAATRLGAMIGTLEYMSPEQADGRLEDMGPPADVFSLGATLYCVLSGTPPVSNVVSNERKRLDYGHFLKPSQINRESPPVLDAISLKALATESSERYQTVAEFVDDLEAWLADEPVAAYTEPFIDRARRWLKLHRTWAASAGAALATSLLALMALLVVLNNHNAVLSKARDTAVTNEKVARDLLYKELRIDQEMLGRNELTAVEIAQLRLKLTEGTFQQYEAWFKRNPEDRQLRAEFAFVARALSNLNRSISNFPQAQAYIKASLDAQNPIPMAMKTDEEKYDFTLTAFDASELELFEGRVGNALLLNDQAQRVLNQTSSEALDTIRRTTMLCKVKTQRSTILFELGNHAEALDEAKDAVERLQTLRDLQDRQHDVAALLGEAIVCRLRILVELGRHEDALPMVDNAVKEMRSRLTSEKREAVGAFVCLLNLAAQIRIDTENDLEQVTALINEAAELLEEKAKKDATSRFMAYRSTTERLRSAMLRLKGSPEKARPAATLAKSQADTLVERLPLAEYLIVQAEADLELSEVYRVLGQIEGADQAYAAANQSLQQAVQHSADSVRIRSKQTKIKDATNK